MNHQSAISIAAAGISVAAAAYAFAESYQTHKRAKNISANLLKIKDMIDEVLIDYKFDEIVRNEEE